MSISQISQVHVHSLVLLSIVDHFNRVNQKSRSKRVIGVLLGEVIDDTIEVVNSYAVPFEEDPSQRNIQFLDHIYHETMFQMMKKEISQKQAFLGWYTAGASFKSHDTQINQVFSRYTDSPVFLVVDILHNVSLYRKLELVRISHTSFYHQRRSGSQKLFNYQIFFHIAIQIKEISLHSLTSSIRLKVQALQGLAGKAESIITYLKDTKVGKLPQQQNNLQVTMNNKSAAKFEFRGSNKGVFSKEQRHDVCNLYLCYDSLYFVASHFDVCGGKITRKNQDKEKLKRRNKRKKLSCRKQNDFLKLGTYGTLYFYPK